MYVDNEIAHLGVVDCLLGGGLPRISGLRIVRVHADQIELGQVLELDVVERGELAAENEVEKLLLRLSAGCRAHVGSLGRAVVDDGLFAIVPE